MPTVNLGRVRMKWRGAWAGSTAYAKDDIVRHGVDTYVATTAHTAHATTFSNDSANWELMAQGSDIPTQSGQSGKALITDGTSLSWGDSSPIVQVKHLQNTTRTTPTNAGTYLNWGSFTKQEGSNTDLIIHGTIHAHTQYGNNVGNPSIRWNGHAEYVGWVRTFSATDYQLGYSFVVRFSAKTSGTSDVTWYVPADDHRWQSVINPTNADTGVSNRYQNTIGSTVTIYEVKN